LKVIADIRHFLQAGSFEPFFQRQLSLSHKEREPVSLLAKLFSFAGVIGFLANGCGSVGSARHLSGLPLLYKNADYGLVFSLPASWKDYSVLTRQWEGETYVLAKDELLVTERGPIIVLRHPKWRADHPSQDIPLLVFTRRQWQAMQEGKFSVGAGGVWEEVMHNSTDVFAISSRFNSDDSVEGWEVATYAVKRNQAVRTPHLNEL
jgi:hypothetical protein